MSNYGTAGLIIDNDIDIEVNTGYFDTDIASDVGLFFGRFVNIPLMSPLVVWGYATSFSTG